MAQKVTLDNLEAAVRGILEEYGAEVEKNLKEVTQAVAKKGVQAIRSESAAMFPNSGRHKKRYSQSWTSTVITGRMSVQGVIYNEQAGLPHLLENGHVSRNGTGRTFGYVAGREHIGRVSEELDRIYEQEVKARL